MRWVVVAAPLTTLLLVSPAWAGKCKPEKGFDGETVYEVEVGPGDVSGKAAIVVKGDALELRFPVWDAGNTEAPVPAGSPLQVRLTNDEAFSWTTTNTAAPTSGVYAVDKIATWWEPVVVVSPEQVRALAAERVSKIQVTVGAEKKQLDYDEWPHRFGSVAVKELARCWVKNNPG